MAPKMPQIDCKLEGCVAKLEKVLDPCFQKMTSKVQGNALKAVSRLWLVTHVLAGCAFICACAATSEWNDAAKAFGDLLELAGDGDDDGVVTLRRFKTMLQSYGFVCIMSGFVAVLMAAAGHYTLTKLKGPLSLGIFTGALFMFGQFFFIITCIFGDPDGDSGNQALAAFSFLMFVMYTLIALMVGVLRGDLADTPGVGTKDLPVKDVESAGPQETTVVTGAHVGDGDMSEVDITPDAPPPAPAPAVTAPPTPPEV